MGGFIAADLAAGHVDRADRVSIHAAAVVRRVGLAGFRAADGAASHIESALAEHIHAAAVVVHRVVGDLCAAVHGERAGSTHIHAAAIGTRAAAGGFHRVAADLAAVHRERA